MDGKSSSAGTSRKRHFGIITPPVSGHIHPFGALGRELIARGHRVTLLQMEDVRDRAIGEGLEFIAVGESDHPPGSLPASLAALGKLDGLAALRFTIRAVCKTTAMYCRDAPQAIRKAGIDGLLVDQTEPAGGSVADHLNIPFVTICNALAINPEARVPPPFTSWRYSASPWTGLRNRIGYAAGEMVMSPITRLIAKARREWNLPPLRNQEDSFSRLAQISQLPRALDYPRAELPATFHYTGPLRNESPRVVTFPWEKLDGRPLVYSSLGTLQNRRVDTFRIFSEACSQLPVQLVIAHGGGLSDSEVSSLPGSPLCVPYAPQLAVLSRCALTITHAGLNTALDSLSYGVPLVAIPITYEQPAIAERIRWSGSGAVLPFQGLNASKLKKAIEQVMERSDFRKNAGRCAESIAEGGGVRRAAEIVESIMP